MSLEVYISVRSFIRQAYYECILGNDALASSYWWKWLTFTLRMVEHARPPKWWRMQGKSNHCGG